LKNSKSSGARTSISRTFYKFARPFARWFLKHWIRHDELIRVRQHIRYLSYSQLLQRAEYSGDMSLYELSVFSQNGEDGVVQEIFRRIGTTNRFFVEIGASPNEANAVFLADVFGWTGCFLDASSAESSALHAKYAKSDRVKVVQAFVTPDNISDLLASADSPEDLDLLSIDVDGNDYWLWEALTPFRPRLVVIEYNSAYGTSDSIISDYREQSWDGSSDFGSSMKGMVALASRLGYRLVHADTTGVNLFFVRQDMCPLGAFLLEEEVLSRVANFYLYDLRHPSKDAP
jgi:hypothetical protein